MAFYSSFYVDPLIIFEQNPPRSRSLSQVLFDDVPQVFDASPLASRRLSHAYTPAGEPSLDAYDQELGPAAATDPVSEPIAHPSRLRQMSMAEYLDEKSQTDTTTPDGIIAQAQADRGRRSSRGFPQAELEASRANVSMTRVTMDLQGHKSPVEPEYKAALSSRRPESYGGVDATSSTRRKSMSEYLSEQAMADTVRSMASSFLTLLTKR